MNHTYIIKHATIQTKSKGLELATSRMNKTAQRLYELNGYMKDEEFYHYYLEAGC